MLVGSQKFIDRALRVRKVLGGGMRQAGYLAAAALYALENNRDRLAEDHRRAAEIGALLETKNFISEVEPYQTNILIFKLDVSKMSEAEFTSWLDQNNIRIIGMGEGKLRIVTHKDYTEEMHRYFLNLLANL
jgi:threonine aldolase